MQLQARPLLSRLASVEKLENVELLAMARALDTGRRLEANAEILREGRTSPAAIVVCAGFACRFKVLGNGRRQITALLIPGDVCDYRFLVGAPLDHGVASLSAATVGFVRAPDMAGLCERHPRILRALMRCAAIDEAITREWMLNLGQRTATERLAHLFCELYTRLRTAGQASQSSYRLTVTQAALGEALGLSAVHVNRTLQDLRRSELISFSGGLLTIPDFDALADLAMFDPRYLGHAAREESPPAAPARLGAEGEARL